jgi:hypothetical protein
MPLILLNDCASIFYRLELLHVVSQREASVKILLNGPRHCQYFIPLVRIVAILQSIRSLIRTCTSINYDIVMLTVDFIIRVLRLNVANNATFLPL